MRKHRLVFVFSLLILGVLLASTVYLVPQREKFTEVLRGQLLHDEGEWILELDIVNLEGKDTTYTVTVMLDGKEYGDKVLIADGHSFTYMHHISPERMTQGEVSFSVYKEGEVVPFEQATYFVREEG
ncbi:hypothetical protein ACFLVD_00570 [Chloroflexota bacterium]